MIDIGWLAANGPCEEFQAGDIIPCPGGREVADRAMYILLSGKVEITTIGKRSSSPNLLFPGDVFCGREFFTGVAENEYTAAADSVVYLLSENSFSDLSWSQPDIVFELLRAAYAPQKKLAALSSSAPQKPVAVTAANTKTVQEKKRAQEAKAAQEARGTQEVNTQQGSKTTQEAKGVQAPKTAQEIKPDPKATRTTAAVAKEQAAASATQAGMSAGDSLFPQGHKMYPGITKPDYMRLVYAKEYVCPFCKKKFSDYKVFSSKLY